MLRQVDLLALDSSQKRIREFSIRYLLKYDLLWFLKLSENNLRLEDSNRYSQMATPLKLLLVGWFDKIVFCCGLLFLKDLQAFSLCMDDDK